MKTMAEWLNEHEQKKNGLTIRDMRNALKSIGADYANGIGWAFPDRNTGTIYFDESSYNETIFLGRNAEDAFYRALEMICEQNDREVNP